MNSAPVAAHTAASALQCVAPAMPLGDLATWVGALAGFLVAFVALLPIFKEWQRSKRRARLAASYLYTPMAYSASMLKAAHPALISYVGAMAGHASADVRAFAGKLQQLCAELRIQLESYDIKEVAFLPDHMGQLLSNGVGQVRVCIGFVEASVNQYFSADELEASSADELRFDAAHRLAFMVQPYEDATGQMLGFAKECRGLLGIPEVNPPSGARTYDPAVPPGSR